MSRVGDALGATVGDVLGAAVGTPVGDVAADGAKVGWRRTHAIVVPDPNLLCAQELPPSA